MLSVKLTLHEDVVLNSFRVKRISALCASARYNVHVSSL